MDRRLCARGHLLPGAHRQRPASGARSLRGRRSRSALGGGRRDPAARRGRARRGLGDPAERTDSDRLGIRERAAVERTPALHRRRRRPADDEAIGAAGTCGASAEDDHAAAGRRRAAAGSQQTVLDCVGSRWCCACHRRRRGIHDVVERARSRSFPAVGSACVVARADAATGQSAASTDTGRAAVSAPVAATRVESAENPRTNAAAGAP